MTLSFELSPEQMAVRMQARQVADEILSEVAAVISPLPRPEDRFYALQPVYKQLAGLGFVKGLVPDQYGGAYFDNLTFALAAEELARVDINTPTALLGTGLGLNPIINFGTEEQKNRWLPLFCDGEPRLAAIAYTEVTGGANYDSEDPTVGIRTFARREGDEWVINGAKHYTTNASGWDGQGADLISVVCRTDPALPPSESLAVIVVEKGTPGVEITDMIDTIGHRATNSPRVEFRDVRVPVGNLIGKPGDGLDIVATAFSWTCSSIAAACVGRMRAAFDYSLQFAKTDHRSGPVPVIEYQNAGYMLVDIKTRIEAVRYFAWKAADHFDRTGGRDRELANEAKIFASETAVQVVYDAMRLVGVDAYTNLTPIAAIMEDVLCFPVYDGGNMGVRRRNVHNLLKADGFDSLAAAENRLSVPEHA
ncbi:acyl-CoA dehydrogenase [Rhodococcus sp. 06-418-5]|uniref:acyl-CoA dehydrogenase family protein n=1 Tax=Rhodococcus sp. 06-418-5 TaxID=2022507 RepID=UPI000B9A1A73|nr:acyl-CoA dehydrogenase family protein [Rhodococcus sp. 06-418-5]OZC87972.1 acyl-CoA dehydrogenase [Rhodococcus sp. 06-418-5]